MQKLEAEAVKAISFWRKQKHLIAKAMESESELGSVSENQTLEAKAKKSDRF